MYDAGSFVVVFDGGDYRDCSDVGTREDIRLARFQGMSSTDQAEADVAGSGRNYTERGDNPGSGRCGSPWVYPSEEGCSSDHDGRVDGGVCTYLCKKWFLLGL
ncbi:hypothetical protein ACHAXA_000366 [Cyclostephanos tholiformis]|uniref:Uncharacterized protein n=1 Tax=Cyclostephanos tholiformis TaxID=382380 RepID=A0ABD3R4R5_9STRA